ncbi:MAG: hypothetical protein JOZ78_09220 [Chroococcidiopsidaceae cyanobacterium CP_BM_ER_R8_30]|nr:hypothetical protein [Chroococcidiopsidaceae cyanobacterium CP_BM_ER_R8_30]
MRILLIEDDDRIARPIIEDLRYQKHSVDYATDGIEGLEFAQAITYDFAHSLSQELTARLITLGQGASNSVELEQGQLTSKTDFPTENLLVRDQALEWFDLQGRTLARQGRYVLNLPFAG